MAEAEQLLEILALRNPTHAGLPMKPSSVSHGVVDRDRRDAARSPENRRGIGLIEELDDCLSKLAFARSEDDAIQLRVVV